jgi:hypothetical protein
MTKLTRQVIALEDHGRVEHTIDTGVTDAAASMEQLAGLGIDMQDAGRTLEKQVVASFHEPFAHLPGVLQAKTGQPARS